MFIDLGPAGLSLRSPWLEIDACFGAAPAPALVASGLVKGGAVHATQKTGGLALEGEVRTWRGEYPLHGGTASIDYSHPISDAGSGFVHVDTNSRSGYNGESSLSRFTYIQGYNLTNASIGYRARDGWELAVFARNLLDADYIQNLTIQAGNSGLILGSPSEPRIIGATLRFRS